MSSCSQLTSGCVPHLPRVTATGLELFTALKPLAFAPANGLTWEQTAASVQKVTPRMLQLVNVNQPANALTSVVLKTVMVTVAANKLAGLLNVLAIKDLLTMVSNSAQNALILFSNTLTASCAPGSWTSQM